MIRFFIIVLTILFVTSPTVPVSGSETGTVKGSISGSEQPGEPTVKFPERKHRFGNVKKGEIIKYDFEVINEGSGVLKLLEIIPA